MSQRNFMNDRYNDEKRSGKTRKSSASAKPKAQRAATVRDPAPKSKKQKKAERREREREAEKKAAIVQSRFEDTDGYKRLRRIWWVCLIGAVVCTAATFFLSNQRTAFFGENGSKGDVGLFWGFLDEPTMSTLSTVLLVLAYALIILAFYIDLGRIRKERKIYNASLLADKSKAASKERKRLKAEQREQEKEAAEKFEQAKAEEEAKSAARRNKLFGLFGGKKKAAVESGSEAKEEKSKASSDGNASDKASKREAEKSSKDNTESEAKEESKKTEDSEDKEKGSE